jgi:hypothetical protein
MAGRRDIPVPVENGMYIIRRVGISWKPAVAAGDI